MRDLSERDEIRAAHAADTGVAGHVERLMGERENAAAWGQDERVAQVDGQLASFGYQPKAVRDAAARRKAAAEEKKAARREPPKGRAAPAGRQQKT